MRFFMLMSMLEPMPFELCTVVQSMRMDSVTIRAVRRVGLMVCAAWVRLSYSVERLAGGCNRQEPLRETTFVF